MNGRTDRGCSLYNFFVLFRFFLGIGYFVYGNIFSYDYAYLCDNIINPYT